MHLWEPKLAVFKVKYSSLLATGFLVLTVAFLHFLINQSWVSLHFWVGVLPCQTRFVESISHFQVHNELKARIVRDPKLNVILKLNTREQKVAGDSSFSNVYLW